MQIRSQQLEVQIIHLQNLLDDLPPGKLFITHNANYYKWYLKDGTKQTYIPKTNRQLAEKLAYKKYLSELLKECIHEKQSIDSYLKHHNADTPMSEHILTDMPEYQELLSPFFQPLSEDLKDWTNSTYQNNPFFPEQLNVKTASGILVRSKSEAIIDMLLYTNHIPFRYECALTLGDSVIYPDFTIRHPKNGKLYYWEHFGLMDHPDYSSKAISKLKLYTSYGIIPSIDLITTYETKNHPLSIEAVEHILRDYFL